MNSYPTVEEIRRSVLEKQYYRLKQDEVEFVFEHFLYNVLPNKFKELYNQDVNCYGYSRFFTHGGDNTVYDIPRKIVPDIVFQLLKYNWESTGNWEEIRKYISIGTEAILRGNSDDFWDEIPDDIITIIMAVLENVDYSVVEIIKSSKSNV